MAETVYNSKNTLTVGAVSFTDVSAPTVVGSTALYGVLAGSNTVAASTVSATSLVGTHYGVLAGSNTVAASTVTGSADATFNSVKVGRGAGSVSTNTAVGSSALNANSGGGENTAVGNDAMLNNTSGNYNTAVGRSAMRNNTTGGLNTAVGYTAMNNANSTGTENTAIGYQAMFYNTTGSYNTAVGKNAMLNNNTGENNTAVGTGAGPSTTALTNTTCIGYNASASASNSVILGSGANVGIGTASPGMALDVVGTVRATTLTGAGSGITLLNMGNAGSGTLAVARGGTGTTSSTGTGSVVLSANPTLSGTVTAGTFSGSAASLTSFPTLNQNTTGSSGSCTGTANYANSAGSAPASGGTATSVSGGSVNVTSCLSTGGFQHSYGANGLISGGLSYNGNIQFSYSGPRAVDTIFFYTAGNSSYNSVLQGQLTGQGWFYMRGGFSGGGADYAELFEWADGNPNNEDRVGYPVVLVDDKIAVATENSTDIIGVISNTPTVIGDGSPMHWHGKYLKDDFGRPMYDIQDRVVWNEGAENHLVSEPGLVIPPDATYFTDKVEVLNPLYDESIPYNPRDMRKEWGMVGLMGKIYMRKSQPSHPNWKCMKIKANSDLWFVR